MKTRTSTLIGPALDWLVAKCRGYSEIKIYLPHRPTDRGWIEVRFNPEPKATTARFDPTENWFLGGPIIERGGIAVERKIIEGTTEHEWKAYVPYIHAYGPTPLIAAMRCYVASKLGDEVEVPDALLS